MFFLKACPRCKTGDVCLERDEYGNYFRCLHCSWVKDVPDVTSGLLTSPRLPTIGAA